MITSTEVLWRLKCALKRAGNVPVSTLELSTVERCGSDFRTKVKFAVHSKSSCDVIVGRLFEMSLRNYIHDVKMSYFVSGQHCSIDFILCESSDGKTNIDESVIEAVGKLKWRNNS